MKTYPASAELLKVSNIGPGYVLLKDPVQFVTVFRVSGGANPWVEDASALSSKINQFASSLGQLRPGEQIQIILRRVPFDPTKQLEYFRAHISPEAPVEFRTRYANYYEEWVKNWSEAERLCGYECYLLFTILGESVPVVESFFSKKRQGSQHPSDLVLSRSRTWLQSLSSCGIKTEELSAADITRLLYEEASLDGNHFNPEYVLRSSGYSAGGDSFLNIREKLSTTPALFNQDHFQVGRQYGKTFYVSEFPDAGFDPMFLSQFLTQRDNFKITLFARGIDQAQARASIERQLKGDLGTLQKGNLVNVDSQAMM